jgi:hypothetical protein
VRSAVVAAVGLVAMSVIVIPRIRDAYLRWEIQGTWHTSILSTQGRHRFVAKYVLSFDDDGTFHERPLSSEYGTPRSGTYRVKGGKLIWGVTGQEVTEDLFVYRGKSMHVSVVRIGGIEYRPGQPGP